MGWQDDPVVGQAAEAGKPAWASDPVVGKGRELPGNNTGEKPAGVAGNAVALADTVLGFPAFLAKIGMRGAAETGMAVAGDPDAAQHSNEIFEEAMQAPWMQLLSKPVETLTGIKTRGSLLEKAGEVIAGEAEKAVTALGGEGAETKALTGQALDVVMAAGLPAAQKGYNMLAKHKAGNALWKELKTTPTATPEDIFAEVKKAAETPLYPKDSQINAQAKAHDLMQRGASIKEVEKEIARNPLIETEMTKIRQRRSEAISAMQHTLQGEVLPPESRTDLAIRRIPPPGERGSMDTKTMAALAAGSIGAMLAMKYPDEAEKYLGYGALAAAILTTEGRIPEEALKKIPTPALEVALRGSNYTLKTLERLPKNWTEFPKKMIEEQMRRADVKGAERDVLKGILDGTPGDKIQAKELVTGFRQATGDFQLTPKETPQYADYGLENIGRSAGDQMRFTGKPPHATAASTMWELPEGMNLGPANHMGNPKMFGWTRSFEENGITHVVEVQSDAAQRAKTLSPEKLTAAENGLATAQAQLKALKQEHQRSVNSTDPWGKEPLRRQVQEAELRVRELNAKLAGHEVGELTKETLGSMMKEPAQRLIREALWKEAQEGRPMTRFASADTVAKVEGWPRAERPYDTTGKQTGPLGELTDPGHQSIYNRYAGEITKFLKQQGGKEVTDAQGHTWWEVPTAGFKGRKEMFGKADPKLLAMLAGAGLGAYALSDDRLQGALLGGIGGYLVAGRAGKEKAPDLAKSHEAFKQAATEVYRQHGPEAAKAFIEARGKLVETATGVHGVERLIGQGINDIQAKDRLINNDAAKMLKAVPDEGQRSMVAMALDTGAINSLPSALQSMAKGLQSRFADIGQRALEAGVLDSLRENYISHIVDWGKSKTTLSQELIDSIMGKAGGASSSSSKFAKGRKYATFEELQHAIKDSGLVLRTTDPVEIWKTYAQSMETSIINRNVISALKETKDSEGRPYMRPITERTPVRPGETLINAPGLRNLAVRDDIARQVKFHFEHVEPSEVMKAAYGISQFVKMDNVFGSLFHAKSLGEAALLALGPLNILKSATGQAPGMHAALKQLHEGGLGDSVDRLIKGGVRIDVPGEITQGMLRKTGALADRILDAGGVKTQLGEKVLGGVGKVVEEPFTKFTWDYLHAGLKPYTAMAMLESAKRNHPGVPEAELIKQIAPVINSVYGGQNWFELATSFEGDFMKNLALGALNSRGRAAGQVLLFALDWTTSAWRTLTMAAGEGTGVKGLVQPLKSADYARQYQLRTALTYLTVVDGINYAASGHHLWDPEQKDYTRIEFPDGTSIQPLKHAAEPAHWITDPSHQLANKLGFLPKLSATWLFNLEYASPSAPKMKDPSFTNKLKKTGEAVMPFTVQAAIGAPKGEGASRAVMGALGVPKYGIAKDPAAVERTKQRLARKKRRLREESE